MPGSWACSPGPHTTDASREHHGREGGGGTLTMRTCPLSFMSHYLDIAQNLITYSQLGAMEGIEKTKLEEHRES